MRKRLEVLCMIMCLVSIMCSVVFVLLGEIEWATLLVAWATLNYVVAN